MLRLCGRGDHVAAAAETQALAGIRSHHRCSAPFAHYRKYWPCRRTWERAAIDGVTNGLEQLHTEVFRGPSLDEVLARGERFFSVMPAVGAIPEEDDEASTIAEEVANHCAEE